MLQYQVSVAHTNSEIRARVRDSLIHYKLASVVYFFGHYSIGEWCEWSDDTPDRILLCKGVITFPISVQFRKI